jgi:hypothetical protein
VYKTPNTFSLGFSGFMWFSSIACRFDSIYLDDTIRIAKDIRGDYLVVEKAPYAWEE